MNRKIFELDFSKCDKYELVVNDSVFNIKFEDGKLNITFNKGNVSDFGLVEKVNKVKREKVKFFVETEDEITYASIKCKKAKGE